jgi:NtrC-family two-component system sensor histidine kinase KinB
MLRRRLLLGLCAFLVLLLGLGVVAMMLLGRMAQQVDDTVTGDYRSILVAQAMRVDIAVLEREAWAATTATTNTNPPLDEALLRLEQDLTILTEAASTAEERVLTGKVHEDFKSFRAALAGFRSEPNQQLRRDVYQLRMVPALLSLDLGLQKIRDANDLAIVAAPGGVQSISRNITQVLLIALSLLVLVSTYVFIRIGRSILLPIQTLTQATRALGEGHWTTPVPVNSNDELGELARSFNTMARQLQEYRESTTDEIIRLHRTMESTLASFPDPIFVLNHCGMIDLKNPAAEDLSKRAGFTDKLPDPLGAIAARSLAHDWDYLPSTFTEVITFRFAEGTKHFLPRVLAMHTKQGELFGVAVVLYDVTRFRLLDAAKTNLVATVSHELKSPLTGLRMALHLVTEKTVGELLPKQEELLESAKNDAERLLRILNDLLDLARLDSGLTELNRTAMPPAKIISSMMDLFAPQAANQGVSLSGDAATDLPAVFVDEQRIHHVFSNLLSNAIKHSPRGGQVRFAATRAEDGSVEFAVSDEGPGVPEEFKKQIFERFFRVPKQEKTGAGLGLSIAREIVQAHDGRIGIRNGTRGGSTFFVCLPTQLATT